MKGSLLHPSTWSEARRRRRIRRLLRRMDRLDRSPRRLRRPRRLGARPRATSAVLLLALLLVGLWRVTAASPSAAAFPDRPGDAEDRPLGVVQQPIRTSTAFRFLQQQDDGEAPVTYDPCVPVHLVVNPRTIVDGGMRMLDEATDQIRRTTGLVLVVDGLTEQTEPPTKAPRADGGQGWKPVLVSWSDPAADRGLRGSTAGFAGSTAIERDGHRWYVTGAVTLDGPQLARMLRTPDGWAPARSVIMHELGHLVGLAHVDAPGQLMQPRGRPGLDTWGAGDRTGLAALGRGACIDY